MRIRTLCPKCRTEIPLDDINVARDVALCRQCGQTFSYADLVEEAQEPDLNVLTPPKGAWFRQVPPREFEVGATTRSWGAFFLVPFMCVWSGFSLGGIYGTQFYHAHFDWKMSLFGIPFVLGTLLFGSVAVMSVCGRITVRVNGDQGVLFSGVGPIGWRRRFNWRSVTGVRQTMTRRTNNDSWPQITLDGPKCFNFGSGVKKERRDYMYAVLRRQWRESGH